RTLERRASPLDRPRRAPHPELLLARSPRHRRELRRLLERVPRRPHPLRRQRLFGGALDPPPRLETRRAHEARSSRRTPRLGGSLRATLQPPAAVGDPHARLGKPALALGRRASEVEEARDRSPRRLRSPRTRRE